MNLRTQQIFIALKTILVKEIRRFIRIWSQTLLPPAITISLYFIIFGNLIGSQISTIHGFTYMQFIVPGLIMMAMMTNAYANTSTSFFGAKFSKAIEELLVSPVPNYIILLGFICGGILRGIIIGCIVLTISLFFTHLHIQHLAIVISMSLLACLLFSLGGFINGLYAKNFDDISFIPTFVLTPLTYLGGVFYSVDQLPPMWKKISFLNPILNIVDTFRYGILGTSDVNIYFGFGLVIGLIVLLIAFSLLLLKRGSVIAPIKTGPLYC